MIRDGHVTAFYLFDVAEAIALDRIAAIVGQAASPAKLSPKPATPPYVQYQQPPLSFDGGVIGVDDVMGLRVRVRVYDYGIVSFALSRPFTGSWAELIAVGQQLVDNPALEAELDGCCRRLVTRVISALDNPRQTFLFEDYAVFTVSALDRAADRRCAGRRTRRRHRPPVARREPGAQCAARSRAFSTTACPTWKTTR